jgi:hypothetical protein
VLPEPVRAPNAVVRKRRLSPLGPRVDRASRSSWPDALRAGATRGIGGAMGPRDPQGETASDERVLALLVSMALIWTKLAEEAESIQHTKLGVANDDTAGQTQVPPGSASDAMPTLQDTDESAQVRASSWPQVR